MMKACKCGSYAINHHCHGRDGSDDDLCDVCYWRKRAEQPAQQEPVAYWIPKAEQFCIADPSGRPFAKAWEPLYTSPPPTQRKPLTNDEIWDAYIRSPVCVSNSSLANLYAIARAIEAAYNIKENT